ncbi:MAG: hypothetical protein ACYDA2_09045 [Acidimicrobiales bacterium]
MARAPRGSSPSDAARWSWFGAWAVVGGVYAMGLAGAFTIGIVALPVAIVATIVLSGRRPTLVGMPGAGVGVGAVLFYLAFVNRAGPGTVCTRTAGGAGMRCVDETSPWPWLAGGVAVVALAVVLAVVLQRRARGR